MRRILYAISTTVNTQDDLCKFPKYAKVWWVSLKFSWSQDKEPKFKLTHYPQKSSLEGNVLKEYAARETGILPRGMK